MSITNCVTQPRQQRGTRARNTGHEVQRVYRADLHNACVSVCKNDLKVALQECASPERYTDVANGSFGNNNNINLSNNNVLTKEYITFGFPIYLQVRTSTSTPETMVGQTASTIYEI